MFPAVVVSDAEELAIQWARSIEDITSLLINDSSTVQIATSLPKEPFDEGRAEFLACHQVGGVQHTPGVPIWRSTLQWDSWAITKGGASRVLRTVLAYADAMSYWEASDGGTVRGFRVTFGPVDLEDPDTEWKRFMATTEMTHT